SRRGPPVCAARRSWQKAWRQSSGENGVKLYGLKNAPNPRRVKIFLAEKKIALPVEELDIETRQHKTPEFLTKNSLGQLPVLELDDGTTLSESIAICRYFDEMVLPVIDVFVHTHPFWVGKRHQIPVWGEAQRMMLVDRMRWLDTELEGRRYIGIDRYNMADITAQVALLTARGVAKLPIPEDHKNLSRWWAGVTKRPTARA